MTGNSALAQAPAKIANLTAIVVANQAAKSKDTPATTSKAEVYGPVQKKTTTTSAVSKKTTVTLK